MRRRPSTSRPPSMPRRRPTPCRRARPRPNPGTTAPVRWTTARTSRHAAVPGAGAGTSSGTQLTIQQQYDNAYSQCMYSKGNQVPGFQPAVVYAPPPPPPPPAPVAAHPSAYDRGLVRDVQSELLRLGLLIG